MTTSLKIARCARQIAEHKFVKKTDSQIQCAVKELKEKNAVNKLAQHLMAIDGINENQANAVGTQYQTISNLMRAYNECMSEHSKRLMLKDLQLGTNNPRKVGQAASKKIYFSFHSTNGIDDYDSFKQRKFVL